MDHTKRALEWTARRRPTDLRRTLSALSFWASIGLPVLYVPLLLAGIGTTSRLLVFLVLFGLHVLALVGGRGYRQSRD